MKIGLDFDVVISDCGKLKSDVAKILHGLDIPPAKFKKEMVVGEGYLTTEQYRNLQEIIYGTREFGLLMQPVVGMFDYVSKLLALGHSLVIITSRTGKELDVAREWALDKGLSIEFVGIGYGVSKADACTGLDVYIDDDLDKLEPLVDIVPHRFLFSWGYNEYVDEGRVARRIGSWQQFFETITSIEGGR